jgi:hypothetical protein
MCNHQIPAKLYEYLRAGRPIFALTDAIGNTAAALRAAAVTDIVDLTKTSDIANGLRRFLGKLKDGSAQGVSRQVADQHSRRARTRELAVLLNQVVNQDNAKLS